MIIAPTPVFTTGACSKSDSPRLIAKQPSEVALTRMTAIRTRPY